MKALVTGGTGFVGSHVARMLYQSGHEVTVLHRRTSRLKALAGVVYESAIGDVTDLESLRAACKGMDWVFHVAAVADYWRADESRMFDVNVGGTRKVLQAAQEAGVKRVIFTSSAAAVGMRNNGLPADESVQFNFSPQQFPYGYSKFMAEDVVAEGVKKGQDVVTVNPVVVMGPGDLNLISGTFLLETRRFQFLTPYTSGGIAVIDVRDVARAQLAAAEKGRTGERYILSAANYPYRVWMKMIAEVVGVSTPSINVPSALLEPAAQLIDLLRDMGIQVPIDANQARLGGKNVYFDSTKARRELGKPQIAMRQSLEDTYAWYQTHGFIKDDFLTRLIRLVSNRLIRS